LLHTLLSFIQTRSPSVVISGFSANHADKQLMLYFPTKEKHLICSQYSLITDVMLMILRWPKFVQTLIDQIKIN